MTNEEKLLKLLQIAVENGWKDKKNLLYDFESIVDNIYLYVDDVDFVGTLHSLNDLVINWEEGEISFIKSLFNYSTRIKQFDYKVWTNSFRTHVDFDFIHEELEFLWSFKITKLNVGQRIDKRPTSERLDWLFNTFDHLLRD